MHLHHDLAMKTATVPFVRVAPALRAELVSVLAEGESLSEFDEASVRATVERRRTQAEFRRARTALSGRRTAHRRLHPCRGRAWQAPAQAGRGAIAPEREGLVSKSDAQVLPTRAW